MASSVKYARGSHKKQYTCPYCGEALTSRARRGFLVKALLFWLPLKRFVCYQCKCKPYLW